jgi:hypothetical protein
MKKTKSAKPQRSSKNPSVPRNTASKAQHGRDTIAKRTGLAGLTGSTGLAGLAADSDGLIGLAGLAGDQAGLTGLTGDLTGLAGLAGDPAGLTGDPAGLAGLTGDPAGLSVLPLPTFARSEDDAISSNSEWMIAEAAANLLIDQTSSFAAGVASPKSSDASPLSTEKISLWGDAAESSDCLMVDSPPSVRAGLVSRDTKRENPSLIDFSDDDAHDANHFSVNRDIDSESEDADKTLIVDAPPPRRAESLVDDVNRGNPSLNDFSDVREEVVPPISLNEFVEGIVRHLPLPHIPISHSHDRAASLNDREGNIRRSFPVSFPLLILNQHEVFNRTGFGEDRKAALEAELAIIQQCLNDPSRVALADPSSAHVAINLATLDTRMRLDLLPWDAIPPLLLNMRQPVIHIDEALVDIVTQCFIHILRIITETDPSDPYSEIAWYRFILLPKLLFSIPIKGTESAKTRAREKIKERCQNILNGQWNLFRLDNELIHMVAASSAPADRESDGEAVASQLARPPVESKIVNLASEGLISKAVDALDHRDTLHVTGPRLQTLKTLFPGPMLDASSYSQLMASHQSLRSAISLDEVRTQIVDLQPRGSPGLHGLRREHLLSMLNHAHLGDTFLHQFTLAINQLDALPRSHPAFRFWAARELLIVPKTDPIDDTKLRPIGIGSNFVKIALGVSLSRAAPRLASLGQQTLQFGLGVAGGMDIATHTIQALRAEHLSHDLVTLDTANAHNALARKPMLHAVKKHLPEMFAKSVALYSTNPLMWYRPSDSNKMAAGIRCLQGVVQGDAPSSTAYCLATLPLLAAMNQTSSSTVALGYQDDLSVIAPTSHAIEAVKEYDKQAAHLSLSSNYAKFKVLLGRKGSAAAAEAAVQQYCDAFPAILRSNIFIHPEDGGVAANYGVEVLGVLHGSNEAVSRFIRKTKDSLDSRFDKLGAIKHLHTRFLLLKESANAWIGHLLRAYPMELTRELALHFRSRMRRLLLALLGLPAALDSDTKLWFLYTMPVRSGKGLGFADPTEISNQAFLAAATTAYTFRCQSRKCKPRGEAPLSSAYGTSVTKAYGHWRRNLNGKRDALGQHTRFSDFAQVAARKSRLQKALMVAVNASKTTRYQSWLGQLPKPHQAHLAHIAAGSMAALLCRPNGRLLSNDRFLVFSRAISGSDSPSLAGKICSCGVDMREGFKHFSSCSKARADLTSHVAPLSSCLLDLSSRANLGTSMDCPLVLKVQGSPHRSLVCVTGVSTGHPITTAVVPCFPAVLRKPTDSPSRAVSRMQLLINSVNGLASTQHKDRTMAIICTTPELHWDITSEILLSEIGRLHPRGLSYVKASITYHLAVAAADQFATWAARGTWLP